MTRTEKKFIAQFLHKYSDDLSNRVCNDFYVKCTEENLEIIEEFEDWVQNDDPEFSITPSLDKRDNVCVMDWLLCSFLADKLNKEIE